MPSLKRPLFRSVIQAAGALMLIILLLTSVIVLCLVAFTKLTGERETAIGMPRNIAQYVEMSDGTDIAIDIWFPADIQPQQDLPVLMTMTRYWRAEHIGWLQRAAFGAGLLDTSPDESTIVNALNRRDFIVIKVDARGTGASGGDRQSEWSPREIEDFGEIGEWAARQPWSNGAVGALGVSYSGNTAEMLATTNTPAVRAVAPLFSDFDPQFHNAMPGGAFNTGFITQWGQANAALDENDICLLAQSPAWRCFLVKWWTRGVKPVDQDRSGKTLSRLLEKRRSNNVLDALKTVEFRDDAMAGADGLSLKDVSPYGAKDQIERSNTPMFVLAGWMDAATADGAIARYMTFSNPQTVYLGAWSHGGEQDVDPFAPTDTSPVPSTSEQWEQVADFFDRHLRQPGRQAPPQSELHYFTMGARTWTQTDVWPPAGVDMVSVSLGGQAPKQEVTYSVDFDASTGGSTRWHTQMDRGDVVYKSSALADGSRIAFETPPTESAITITGAPAISLKMSTTASDGLVIAYLEGVSPDGDVVYLTEGVMRLLHRRTSDRQPPYQLPTPPPGFWREDGAEALPGEVFDLRIDLLATSVELPAGYRIRISLAGADKGLFDRIPLQEDATWTIVTGDADTRVILPVDGGDSTMREAFAGTLPVFSLRN